MADEKELSSDLASLSLHDDRRDLASLSLHDDRREHILMKRMLLGCLQRM